MFILWSVGAIQGLSQSVFPGYDGIDQSKDKIILIGDTQRTSNWEFWRERNFLVTQRLLKEIAVRDPAFLIILGDLTTRGSSTKKHWAYFDEYTKPIWEKKIPVFPIFGNHEYYGNNETAFENLFTRFPYLQKKTWYSFSFRGTGFLLLNGNFSDLTEKEAEEQKAWYDAELEKWEKDPQIYAVVACIHQPPYTNSKVISGSAKVREEYAAPFIQASKTAFFFSGHCHSFEWFVEQNKNFIVSGGGGGPRHKLVVDKNKRKYKDRFDGPALRFFHFCELTLAKDCLTLKVVRLDDNQNFTDVLEIRFPQK
jgi:hypothetical protein